MGMPPMNNGGQGMERGNRPDGQGSKKNTQVGNKQVTQETESNQAG